MSLIFPIKNSFPFKTIWTYQIFMNNSHVQDRIPIGVLAIRVRIFGPQNAVTILLVSASGKRKRVLAKIHFP